MWPRGECRILDSASSLAGQRQVRPAQHRWIDVQPAILSVKSVLSVVKNTIAFSPRIARITRMNRKGHKKVAQGLKNRYFRVLAPFGTDKLNLEPGAVQLVNMVAGGGCHTARIQIGGPCPVLSGRNQRAGCLMPKGDDLAQSRLSL